MKKAMGVLNGLYPLPTTLVGAVVEGRVNFITIAHVGVCTVGQPECISLGIHRSHFSNAGIHAHQQFSVNIPGEDLVEETDYCGLVTGKSSDKSEVFEVFYGELEFAPLIQRCPINMECRLHSVVEFPQHEIFIGEIVATHVDEGVLSGGVVDMAKVRPLLFDMHRKRYWRLGEDFADCWHAGLPLKRRLQGRG